MGADVAGLVKALDLGKPVVMGHSMGGGAAIMAVVNFPECFSRAIIEDAGLHDFPTGGASRARDRFGWLTEVKSKSRDEVIALGHEQSPTWSDEEIGLWADAKLSLSLNALNFDPSGSAPWRETIARVKLPMLIIRADNDKGASVTPEAAAEASRINSLVESAYVPGVGHSVRREDYDAFMAAVTEFLAR